MTLPASETEAQSEALAREVLNDSIKLYGESHGPSGDRCINPASPEELSDFFEQFAYWKLSGKSVGIVDGSFDVEQPNHYLYLVQCRTAVAAQRESTMGGDWTKLSDEEKRMRIESKDVILVATIDADEKVQRLKGGRKDKGGVTRPVYPWDVRAQRIANYTIGTDHWVQRPVVDIATIEGADHHAGTPLESYTELAQFLHQGKLVDTIIMFKQEGSHSETTEQLRDMGIEPLEITAHNAYIDPRTDNTYSSSDIIKQIRGLK